MRPKCLPIAAVLLFLAACTPGTKASQTSAKEVAALSGTWSGDWGPTADRRNPVTLELRWDGSRLSGTVNTGPRAIEITKAAYDPKTGAITMELDTRDGQGNAVHYGISGQVKEKNMDGKWTREGEQGDFHVTKD